MGGGKKMLSSHHPFWGEPWAWTTGDEREAWTKRPSLSAAICFAQRRGRRSCTAHDTTHTHTPTHSRTHTRSGSSKLLGGTLATMLPAVVVMGLALFAAVTVVLLHAYVKRRNSLGVTRAFLGPRFSDSLSPRSLARRLDPQGGPPHTQKGQEGR